MGLTACFLQKVGAAFSSSSCFSQGSELTHSPDLRARFVRSEVALFRHRFETDDATERSAFLRSLKFDWGVVDEAEKQLLADKLRACMWGVKEEAFKAESWFKVPWYTVPDLIGSRRVYVRHGLAYVPQSLQISLVLQVFASRLEKALEASPLI